MIGNEVRISAEQELNSFSGKIKPSRPYTEYNVFFQIEKEYILQKYFGLKPNFHTSEAFDASRKEYRGPPLPPRYFGVVLHKDWYRSKKKQVNKRSHRLPHGKISFRQLSQIIASSWSNIDEDTKMFCEATSDYCMLEYKRSMREFNSCYSKRENSSKTENSSKDLPLNFHYQEKINRNKNFKRQGSFKVTNDSSLKFLKSRPCDDIDKDLNDCADNAVEFDLSSIDFDIGCVQENLVDIDDEEIIEMWKIHQKENLDIPSSRKNNPIKETPQGCHLDNVCDSA